jgi:hypothetical protein
MGKGTIFIGNLMDCCIGFYMVGFSWIFEESDGLEFICEKGSNS